MENSEENYIPFGPEWHAEVMNHTKKDLVTMLRTAMKHIIELEEIKTRQGVEVFKDQMIDTILPFNKEGKSNA